MGVTVDLLSCDNNPKLCWVGSFSVASTDSFVARLEFRQYLASGKPIQLNQAVRRYVLDTTSSGNTFNNDFLSHVAAGWDVLHRSVFHSRTAKYALYGVFDGE